MKEFIMYKKPTVSVIIPTYNRAYLVGRAIQSVLNQTYQDFELITVDDASTDNTENLIKEFQQKDKRIIYLKHEQNEGGSAARNTGIKVSRGKYIAFLDSDDEWFPEKLEKQVDIFKKYSLKLGAVYTGFQYVDIKSKKEIKKHIPRKRGNLYKDLLVKNYIGSTSSLVIKRECFEKVGLFDEELPSCQDYDMWIRIAKKYDFYCIKESLLKYQVHNDRISSRIDNVVKGERIILKKYFEQYQKNPKLYSEHCFLLGNRFCHLSEMREGRRYFFKGIFINPFSMKYYVYLIPSLFGARFYKVCFKLKNLQVLVMFLFLYACCSTLYL